MNCHEIKRTHMLLTHALEIMLKRLMLDLPMLAC
jgi:hypothetical protein